MALKRRDPLIGMERPIDLGPRLFWWTSVIVYALVASTEYYALDFDSYVVESIGQGPRDFGFLREGLLIFISLTYGALRMNDFPGTDGAYLRWLDTTPWREPHPTPFRRYQLSWPDLLAMIVIMLAGQPKVVLSPWHYPAAMLASRLFFSFGILAGCHDFRPLWVIPSMAIGCWLCWDTPFAVFAILAIAYAIVSRRTREAFNRMIWNFDIRPGDAGYVDWRRDGPQWPRIGFGFPWNRYVKRPEDHAFPRYLAISSSAGIAVASYLLIREMML